MKDRTSPGTSRWSLLGLFIVVAVMLAAAGYAFYLNERREIRALKYNELRAVAELKANQIQAWRQERVRDARMNLAGPFFRAALRGWTLAPDDLSLRSDVSARLQLVRNLEGYEDVILAGIDGRVMLSLNSGLAELDAGARHLIERAVLTGEVVFGDFYTCPVCAGVHIDVAAPVFGDDNIPMAVLILRTDPEQYLYPLIQSWPTPSHSSETLLVRREGSDVLFLNTLRHRSDPALTMKLPLSQADLPAARAVLGHTGQFEGRDYRGVEVLADIRPVQGSPWFMISKVDREEILADVRYHAKVILLFVVLAILMTGAMAGFVFNYRRRSLYRALNAELEQRVRDRTTQLEAVNQELEAFAYSVSHDLRAPLRAMTGFSGALLSTCSDGLDEKGRHYLQRIEASAERMGRLIDDMLLLSRVSRREMSRGPVDLSGIAREIAAELRAQDSERRVEFAIPEAMPAEGDAQLLRLALENLMANAWKFTGPRGQARIEVGVSERSGERAYFVRDNGVGFDMAYADKLFAPFQRLHGVREFPGTGIGLATVQRVIRRHGGRVWAEAGVDRGATFHFTLGEGS
ncbi:MAG: ATP-binding protein [Thermodesulfobacteriota bacterium]